MEEDDQQMQQKLFALPIASSANRSKSIENVNNYKNHLKYTIIVLTGIICRWQSKDQWGHFINRS
jgi:hypothetical protein